MIKFLLLFIIWFTYSAPAFAVASLVLTTAFLATTAGMITAFAINMVATMIISKVLMPSVGSQEQPNPGNRQQIPPAGDNKLPVLYGSAYIGGTIVDLSISQDNQDIYYVLALCEVTNSENGNTPDVYTFGDVYFGGKKCVFGGYEPIYANALDVGTQYTITTVGTTDWTLFGAASNTVGLIFIATSVGTNNYLGQGNVGSGTVTQIGGGELVTGLLDESTGETQDVTGYLDIWLYSNGSNNPYNTSTSAISVMETSGLVYQWDNSKQMSDCAFAIIHIKYSQSRNLVALNQTKFQVINPRNSAGDCIQDYLTSTRYGAAIDISNIDTASITALNTYSNASFTYTDYDGVTATQPRFKFNGTLDTNQKIMVNLQNMADCCDCLIRYSEITSLWGVIVQKPTNTIAMDINDSNMISAIQISPIDLANSFNIVEVKFPDETSQDGFNSATFDLAVVNPALLFPNEPVNKQSVSLILCNNNVQAQYIANRFLEAAREDLQMQVDIDYTGLQLDAGDIVTVTNANYGWVAKQFRVTKVIQKFSDSGQVTAGLSLTEFNGAVYDDVNITQFQPSPNSGLGSPTTFGNIPAPTVSNILASAASPAFNVNVTSSSKGVTQYAEVWYSFYQYPSDAQRIFAGTTEIAASGQPYGQSQLLPPVQLFNIPAGNWYFFSRMVNNIATSNFSLASSVLQWRPTTFQFTNRWLSVAFADSATGTGFSLSPTNKQYYGLLEQSNDSETPLSPSTTVSDYKWYLADPTFGTNKYLVFINYSNRRFAFDTDFATYANGSASSGIFVPATTNKFDIRLWSALDPTASAPNTYANAIDLDRSTGQVIQNGFVTGNPSTGSLAINNTNDGRLTATLEVFLPQIPEGTYLTGSAATITVDRFGRVVGFVTPDDFYFNQQFFTATSGQTVFTPTARVSGYISGQDLIFKNGLLLDTSEYTETTTTFTLSVGATTGDIITCLSMRAVSSGEFYEPTFLSVESTSTNTMVWTASQMPYQLINAGDKITFANTGTPTQYTVSSVNYTTRTITFTTNPTASAGALVYRYRAAGSSYPAFSRWSFDLTAANTYTPTTWAFNSGYEIPFLNGTIVNEQDYDLISGAITNFPALATGKMNIIQLSNTNLDQPTGSLSNVIVFTSIGLSTYSFSYDANAFNLFSNGLLLKTPTDYTTATNSYTLTTTPNNSTTILVQQTFASSGAA